MMDLSYNASYSLDRASCNIDIVSSQCGDDFDATPHLHIFG